MHILEILTQIALTPTSHASEQVFCLAVGEPQRNLGLGPGQIRGQGVESQQHAGLVCFNSTQLGNNLEAMGAEVKGDLMRGGSDEFLFDVDLEGELIDDSYSFLDILAVKDRTANPLLEPIANVSEQNQGKAQSDKGDSSEENAGFNEFPEVKSLVNEEQASDIGGRKARVHEKANEGIEKQEAIILQQDNEGYGNADVMPGNFRSPGRSSMFIPEVRERTGE
jgi:hypothetical protein